MWKKSDEEHNHINTKNEGIEWLSENGHISGSTSPDTSENNTSENPVFGDIDPDADPDPKPDTSDQVELPCSCDSYDPSDAPDPPYKITCPDCGQSWRVRE
jgi:hypothetical protein